MYCLTVRATTFAFARDSDARDSIVSKERRKHADLVNLIDFAFSMEKFGVKIVTFAARHGKMQFQVVQNLCCRDEDPGAGFGQRQHKDTCAAGPARKKQQGKL